MPKQELFFSVLNELARQARQAQPLAQWERYLQPGKVLTRGGVQFPLRQDEVKYGPLSILRRDVRTGAMIDPTSVQGLYGIQNPQGAITPAELADALERIQNVAGDLPSRGGGGNFGETQPAFHTRHTRGGVSAWMHYPDMYQLPGPKLDQAEELTLLPGSDYVAQTGHFGGQPGLLSWSRTTRRPLLGARALKPSERPDVMADFSVNDRGEVFQNVYYDGEGIKPVYRGNVGQNQTLGEFVDINYPRYREGKVEEAWTGPTATHIEEIQSDWHQKAREYGYAPPQEGLAQLERVADEAHEDFIQNIKQNPAFLKTMKAKGWPPDETHVRQLINSDGSGWSLKPEEWGFTSDDAQRFQHMKDTIKARRDLENQIRHAPPAAPYKDTYAELELKKGIATAVERGDDYVTWTTGQQQVDRWSEALRQRVGAIEWHKKPNGKYDLAVFGVGNRQALTPMEDLGERTTDLTEQDLKNLLGSEVADRIVAGEGKREVLPVSRWKDFGVQRDEDGDWYGYAKDEDDAWVDVTGPFASEREADHDLNTWMISQGVGDTSEGRANAAFMQRRGNATESGLIEGDKLAVGGSGMRQFYDTKVKDAATRLAKQYGGEVTQVDLPGAGKRPQYSYEVVEDLGQLYHDRDRGINITENQMNELIGRLERYLDPEMHDALYDVGYAHIKLLERRDALVAANEARIAALPPRTTPTEGELLARWREGESISDEAHRRGVLYGEVEDERSNQRRIARNDDMIERMRHLVKFSDDPEFKTLEKDYIDRTRNLYNMAYEPKPTTQKVWALKITPEMKKKVLEAGLPLFSVAGLTVGEGRYGEEPEAPAMAAGGQPRSYFELPGLPQLPQLAAFGLYDPQPPRPAHPLPDPSTLDDRLEALTRLLSGEDRPDAEVVPEDKGKTVEPVERAGTVRPYDLAAAYGQRVAPRAEPTAAAVNPAIATPAAPGMATPGPTYLDALMAAESGGDPDAASTTSSALGPFQFTEGTWADVAYRHPELDLGDDRTDPAKARLAAEALTADNAELLLDAGLEPTDLNLRAAHLLGARGAARFLMAAAALPGTPARDHVSPDAAAANPGLFTHKDGTPVTSAELLARLGRGFPGRTWAAARERPAG